MDQYYRTLGLQPKATPEEIRRAYRRLAKQYHPDLNPSPDARARFLDIVEAYEVLLGERKAAARKRTAPVDHEAIQRKAREEALKRARMRYAEFRRQRDKEQGEAYGKALIWVAALVVAYLTWMSLRGPFRGWMIQQAPYATTCTIQSFSNREAWIAYTVEGQSYYEPITLRKAWNEPVAGNGMPIRKGHTFALRCNAQKPHYFEVVWELPNVATLNRYFGYVAKRLPEAYPEMQATEEERLCLARNLFEMSGLDALANIYFFDEPAIENYKHNAITFGNDLEDLNLPVLFPDCFVRDSLSF
jgi:hypothetical protein